MLGPAARGCASTEPSIVMADSRIAGNVESPLARSVVESSTTGVDADTPITIPAALGEPATFTLTSIPHPTVPELSKSGGTCVAVAANGAPEERLVEVWGEHRVCGMVR